MGREPEEAVQNLQVRQIKAAKMVRGCSQRSNIATTRAESHVLPEPSEGHEAEVVGQATSKERKEAVKNRKKGDVENN